MAYCGPRGIPYLHFMGGPDEWDPLSRRLALLWSSHDRGKCRGCGTHPDDWDESIGGDRKAWIPGPIEDAFCFGCEALHAAQAALPKDSRDHHAFLIRSPTHPANREAP